MNSNKYILVKGSSGLGNRILALSSAILYGQISGRQVIVDWRDGTYGEPTTNSFFQFFDCPSVLPVEDILSTIDTLSVYPSLWKDNLDESFGGLRQKIKLTDQEMTFEVGKIDYQEDLLVFCAYTHKTHKLRPIFQGEFSYLSKMDNNLILKETINKNINLKPQIKSIINQFKEENFRDNNIGVHIRYTDMKIDYEKIFEIVEKILKKQNNEPNIFLATDSQEMLEKFKQLFPRVTTTNKWFPTSSNFNQRLHQNWDECTDRVQNGIEALTDIYLLAECENLVFSSSSSFGYLASLLNSNSKRNLYDINQPSLYQKLRKKILG